MYGRSTPPLPESQSMIYIGLTTAIGLSRLSGDVQSSILFFVPTTCTFSSRDICLPKTDYEFG